MNVQIKIKSKYCTYTSNRVVECLVQWSRAQLHYHEFLSKVESELARLAEVTVDLQSFDHTIATFETTFDTLKLRWNKACNDV